MNGSESFKIIPYTLEIPTSTALEFIDITDNIEILIKDTKISNGSVIVFSKHTTSAIVIQEDEPFLIQDFKSFLENLAPAAGQYKHNDFEHRTVHMHDDECPNGHSHCQQLLLGTSETIPIINGDMVLGKWQRIFMVELDGLKAKQIDFREVVVQIMGQ
jgi:secondary thiamine-phosphate synthase enzyme